MSAITFESSRFGTVEIAAEDVIEFPTGLIGLSGSRYALIAPSEDGAFAWLHSIDDAALALPVANPWHFFGDFEVELSDKASEPITADPSDVAVWVTVRAGTELSDFYANLRAPILIAEGKGHQIINEAADAPVRAPLFPAVAVAA
ncbi:flagellar assembly protein FliW [Solirubrobacter sp. CPCC 204708]|uniref:Flagellar assembly protein FliW n=1 Tax=Solirubrobacter deserti TaxID=2282478 RepID=A0ABT4RMK0_9ACTN|nr:flagellar assembly protein FliW [Solirubrobacter deserti]MBE2316954.1 flagellar assembly protein FliW [Solirubrobacter deserti]MDA0139785.1 flagellar assembly protein FliW [Solirubrobacter deserti]